MYKFHYDYVATDICEHMQPNVCMYARERFVTSSLRMHTCIHACMTVCVYVCM